MAKIDVIGVKARATEDEKVVADIEAALYLEGDGKNGGMRVPNISFEVKTAIAKAVGISSEIGFLEINDVLVDACSQEDPASIESTTAEFLITATYTEGDKVKKVSEKVKIDIGRQLSDVFSKKKVRKATEASEKLRRDQQEAQRIAEAERLRKKRELYEALEPGRKRQIKADITQAGEDIKSRERLQIDPFNVLREYADHPHAEKVALEVANEAPLRTLKAVRIYKSTGWAAEVVKIATEKEPEKSIEVLEEYKDKPWAPLILKTAAKRFPHQVVKALARYEEFPWAEKVINSIAEDSPQAVFEEVQMWEYHPWAEKVAMTAASRAPEFTINNFSLYQTQPWAKRVYDSVAARARLGDTASAESQRLLKKMLTDAGNEIVNNKKNPEIAKRNLAKIYEHRTHPYALTVMMKVANENPDICIENIDIYKSAKWAGAIMVHAASKSYRYPTANLVKYREMPWAGEVMKTSARVWPAGVIIALPQYAQYVWAKSVVLETLKIHTKWDLSSSSLLSPGRAIFEHFEFIEFQPWAEEVVRLAAKTNPIDAVDLREKYQDYPWAAEIIKQAQKDKAKFAPYEEGDDPSSGISRRKLIKWGLLGIAGLAGLSYGGYHGIRWAKSSSYEKRLKSSGINLEDISEDPDEILPSDINANFSLINALNTFKDMEVQKVFKKNKNGTYKYEWDNVMYQMLTNIFKHYSSGQVEMIADGFITINKSFDDSSSASSIDIPDWLTLEIIPTETESTYKVKIVTKQTPDRPISEILKFTLEKNKDGGNYFSDIDHEVEIQYGYFSKYKSKVIHSAKGQAAIREKRRKRALEEKRD